jgi:hypothetical protein
MVSPNGYWSIITSPQQIESCKVKYFNEEFKSPVKDAFVEHDTAKYSSFQSEIDLTSPDNIKKYGKLLETLNTNEIYYIDPLDRFAVLNKNDGTFYTFDSQEHRKKYGIPYQDERFN